MAVAAGHDAVVDLERCLGRRRDDQQVSWVVEEGLAVAWAADNHFVSTDDDGDVLVVLDGQLHNLWHPDRSQASLLRERYGRDGDHLATGLLGDFVLVVLDRTRRTMLVCRDPLGVRPWYQATSEQRHSGATAEATLCELPWVDARVDETMALAYAAFHSVSRGPTLHRGITTLAPGSTWRTSLGSARTWRHHEWNIAPNPRLRWEEAAERCRELVDEAVRSRLLVSRAMSCELSGGLDSSTVAGTAVLLGAPPLVGRLLFTGGTADERDYSDAVIRQWDLEAISAQPWIPAADELEALSASLRRPVPDANFTMFGTLHRAFVAAGRSRGLTGLGGDDVFIAMPYETRVLSALQQRRRETLGPLLRATTSHPRRAWRDIWRPTARYFSAPGRPRPPGYITAGAARQHGLEEMFGRPPRLTGVAAIDQRAVNLTTGHTAFLLELRALLTDLTGHRDSHPFLDPRVIEGLYGLDVDFPVRGGHYRALQGTAFADRLPPVVRDRRTKAEFSEVFWPQALTEENLHRVTTGPLVARGWLHVAMFQNIVDGAREGRPWAAVPLSRAVETDRWLRQADG